MASNQDTLPIPPPPPPPIPLARAPMAPRPTLYVEKLPIMQVGSIHVGPPSTPPYSTYPVKYFFYGTLAQPEVLRRILDLVDEPSYRPAHIIGYSLSNWGQYRTLIDGEPGEEVKGMVYEVTSESDEAKLVYYETKAYKTAGVRLHFDDGEEPAEAAGNTFMYAGDAEALKAGRFDRVLWERTIGMRMPRLKSNGTRPADCPPLS